MTLDAGATLGPHSVILPAARIGEHGTVGPASLVMRGELVPGRQPLERQPDRPVARGHLRRLPREEQLADGRRRSGES